MQGFLSGGWGQVIVILIGIGLGVLYGNARISDLKNSVDAKFGDFKNYVDAKFAANDRRFDDLKDFIRSEVHRLEDRMDRLEGRMDRLEGRIERPIYRP